MATTGITYNDKKFYLGTVSSFQQNFAKLTAAEKAKFNNAITFIGSTDSTQGGLAIMVMMSNSANAAPAPYYFTMSDGASSGSVGNMFLTVHNDDEEYFRDKFTFNRALDGYNLDATGILSNVFLKKSDWKDAFISEGKVVVIVKATDGKLYDKNDCTYDSGQYIPNEGVSAIEDTEVTGEGKYIRFTMKVEHSHDDDRTYCTYVDGTHSNNIGTEFDLVEITDWKFNNQPLYEWYNANQNYYLYTLSTKGEHISCYEPDPENNTFTQIDNSNIDSIVESGSVDITEITNATTEYIYISIADMVSDPAIITTIKKTSTQIIDGVTVKFDYDDYEMSDGIVDNKVITQWETQDCAWGFIRNPYS